MKALSRPVGTRRARRATTRNDDAPTSEAVALLYRLIDNAAAAEVFDDGLCQLLALSELIRHHPRLWRQAAALRGAAALGDLLVEARTGDATMHSQNLSVEIGRGYLRDQIDTAMQLPVFDPKEQKLPADAPTGQQWFPALLALVQGHPAYAEEIALLEAECQFLTGVKKLHAGTD